MYNLLGYISANNIEGVHQEVLVDKSKILGTYEEIEKVIEEQNINEVIIAMPLADNAQMLEIINNLDGKVNKVKFTPELNGVYTFNSEIENYDGTMLVSAMLEIINNLDGKVNKVKFTPELNGVYTFNSEIENYDGTMLVSAKINLVKGIGYFIKRVMDIFISFFGVLSLIPLTILIWLKTDKEERKHGLFFTQTRIGKDEKEIKIYKYRSMVTGADKILEDMMARDEKIREEYEKNKKLKNDPRITKIGEFLRRTSLDEFPQFINVLKGEMSFVGPRPYLPREKKDMGSYNFNLAEN